MSRVYSPTERARTEGRIIDRGYIAIGGSRHGTIIRIPVDNCSWNVAMIPKPVAAFSLAENFKIDYQPLEIQRYSLRKICLSGTCRSMQYLVLETLSPDKAMQLIQKFEDQ